MENNIIVFDYQGSNIPFELTGNDIMINATEMAKLFPGKRIAEWKRLPSTINYLEAMFDMGFSHFKDGSDLIISNKGSQINGSRGGGSTWMHRLVAIEFARWLSPKFSIWCNMKIDEVINQGYAFRDIEIQRLYQENNNLQGMIQSMQPQVDYYNQVLQGSENTYTLRDICGEGKFKVSYRKLFTLLEQEGYIYYSTTSSGKRVWNLKNPWNKEGYTKVVTILDKTTGKPRNQKRWTEEGRYWIYSIAKKLQIII